MLSSQCRESNDENGFRNPLPFDGNDDFLSVEEKNVLVFNRTVLVFYTDSNNGDVNINVSVFEDMLKSHISECL